MVCSLDRWDTSIVSSGRPQEMSRRYSVRAAGRAGRAAIAPTTGADDVRTSRWERCWSSPAHAGGHGSAHVDADLHRYAVRQDVEDGRTRTRLLDERPQRLGRGVTGDGEVHGDVLEAVANGLIEPEDAVEVDVAAHGRAHLGQRD